MERTRTIWIAAALVAVVAVLAFFTYQKQQQKKAVDTPASETARENLDAAGLQDAAPEDLVQPPAPPESPRWDAEDVTLAGSDTPLRGIVRELSGHPLLASMLSIDDLAPTFVAMVDNIAEGATPARHLAALAPEKAFIPGTVGETLVFSDGSASRYDLLTGLVLSLSPEDCVELYQTFYPMLSQAYQELGYPEGEFHHTVIGALNHLIQTPEPREAPLLVRKVTTYAFADPQLESLTPAQKQLLRTGVANSRRIKMWLTEVDRLLTLGAP